MLRTDKFKVKLKRSDTSGFKLYTLALDGTRHKEIPLKSENGRLKNNVNTDKLKEASVYFELIQE